MVEANLLEGRQTLYRPVWCLPYEAEFGLAIEVGFRALKVYQFL